MSGPNLDQSLLDACFSVARSTMWDRRPVDVSSIQATAQRFYEIARDHCTYLEEQGEDPAFVVRAVRYLGSMHAIPPMRDSTSWFEDMLQVLVELRCPNGQPPADSARFLFDLIHGIADTIETLTIERHHDTASETK